MTRKFKFDWRLTLLVVVLFPLMIGLGFWQIHRAEHNRTLIEQAKLRREEAPVSLSVWLSSSLRAQSPLLPEVVQNWQLKQVKMTGHWLPQFFLLENQIYAEKNGYYVIGVMQLDGLGRILVNRGWIQAPPLRSQLPAVPSVSESGEETGEIYVSSSWAEDKPLFAESGWPRRVGRMNLPGAERELASNLLPVVVRLRPGSPSALAAEWTIVNILPEKNIAYAVQWFCMAVALLICYGFYSYRNEK